ncbi:MAG: hypothetical protein ACKER6_01035 [Candidatus Hodgkinia cicadicola]
MCAISSELKITFACRLCFRLASDGRSFGNISEQNILAAPNAFCKVKVGYLDLAACERAKALFLEPSATKWLSLKLGLWYHNPALGFERQVGRTLAHLC